MLLREYIRYLIMENEACRAPKVIFMAGAPGAGKSRVIRRLGLRQRLRVINPDDQYEAAMKAECIPMNRETLMSDYMPIRAEYLEAEQADDVDTMERLAPEYNRLKGLLSRNMKLFNKARTQAKLDREECCLNRKDYLVDGTGGNSGEIKKQVTAAKDAGYDIAMIYVHVPLEESQRRNKERGKPRNGEQPGRSLTAITVARSWSAVNRNRSEYEALFKPNFFVVTNTDEEAEDSINSVSPGIDSFLVS